MANKQPKRAAQPKPEKKAVAAPGSAQSFYDLRPSWRFQTLRLEPPFGWHEVSREKMLEVIGRLRNLETMTWSDILVRAGKENHAIPTSELIRDAQDILEDSYQGGVDQVYSLRVPARERIWGIIEAGVLLLLWWDPEHAVCRSTYMDRRS